MRRLLVWALGLSLLACAWVARTNDRPNVITRAGIELSPTDSHYYTRFAQRQLASFPRFEPFDPFVNFPAGARIDWPVFHTWLVSAFERGSRLPEAGVAWVGPWLSMLELLLVFLLGWKHKGAPFALMATVLLALTPLSVAQGTLGSAEHHLHEPFEVFLVCLFCGIALEYESLAYAIAAGVTLGLARLFTPTAFVPVPMIAAACALAGLLRSGSRGNLAQVAAILGLSGILTSLPWVPLFGVVGVAYEELSFFAPVSMLGLFLFAGGVARRGRRGAILCAAGALVLATLVPQLVRTLAAPHSEPLKHFDLSSQYGLVAILLLPSLIGLGLMLRERKLEALPWLVTLGGLGLCIAFSSRFESPMMGALFGAIALGLPRCVEALPKGPGRVVAYGLSALLVVPLFGALRAPGPRQLEQTLVRPTLEWMAMHLPPVDPVKPQWGVIAKPDLGHLLMLWARLPAVATPFSDAPPKVLTASDDETAYESAKASQGRYLVLVPHENISGLSGVDANATWCHHLWEAGGAAAAGKPASGHFRLIYSARERVDERPYVRVFEVVPGALLRGAAEQGSTVTAGVWARVDGPDLSYRVTGQAGPDGYALRVAHPGKYFVHRDHSSVEVLVTEENLRLGSEVHEPSHEP